jgi:6-phospho-beta-glucosidase
MGYGVLKVCRSPQETGSNGVGGFIGMIDRITVLGGSSVYTPEFVASAVSRNLNVKEIVLFGKPGRKLELVAAFCERLIKKSGFPTKITFSSDIKEAVVGAQYVLNHIRVGGMEARMRDEMLPPKLGMLGDETLGAGGFANAMRTLPIIFELAEQIEEVNPETTLINLSNPMGIIVEALIKYSNLNVVGLCDLPGTYARKVARVLQQEPEDIRVDYVGIAHLGWIQDVKMEKRSYMSKLLELIEENQEDGFDYELIDLFRMIPTRRTGVFFHRDEILKEQRSGTRFRAEILHEAEKRILKLYENKNLCDVPELTRQRNAVWYEDTILPLIEALENSHEKNIILCIKNDKSIRDLPEDCSVEVPTSVSHKGIRTHKVGSLPRFLKGMYLAAKESERLTIEAVRHKSHEYALQALTINPFVPSIDLAQKYLARIVKEEKLQLH